MIKNLIVTRILLILLILSTHFLLPRNRQPGTAPHPFTRRKSLRGTAHKQRQTRKPGKVKTEVLRLLTTTRGQAGCRTIAALFNERFATRGESVSKTYLAKLRKKSRYEISQLRRKLRQPPKPWQPNQTWALDWTHFTIGTETHTLPGVMDHGSRRLLALCFADRSAKTVLTALSRLITTFGKPKSLGTENDGALISLFFALAMRDLRIKYQRSEPHSPWMNGRIERFFGTFKSTIRHIQIDTKAALQQAMDELRFHYNHIRPHQNLGSRTPEMAWTGKMRFPKCQELHWFEAWEGVLCGWLYMPKPQRLQRQNS